MNSKDVCRTIEVTPHICLFVTLSWSFSTVNGLLDTFTKVAVTIYQWQQTRKVFKLAFNSMDYVKSPWKVLSEHYNWFLYRNAMNDNAMLLANPCMNAK